MMSGDNLRQEPAAARSTILSWLRLMRLPTVFTALSNILCGFFVSTPEHQLPELIARPEFWLLLLSGTGLYLGGMVLNDVFDVELDRRERPERPIPSGQISRRAAAICGGFLVATGTIAAFVADCVSSTGHTSFQIACVLAAAVVLYDAVLKSTLAAPLGMGTCRFLNIMLGASCAGGWETVWSLPQVAIAAALAVYVVGVTWFARHEAGRAARPALVSGIVIVMAGIGINGWVALHGLATHSPATGALIVLGLIAANILLRSVQAVRLNQPVVLQKTVGFMLLNIILMDAAMTFYVTGSGRLAVLVVILVIPATLLKRVIPLS